MLILAGLGAWWYWRQSSYLFQRWSLATLTGCYLGCGHYWLTHGVSARSACGVEAFSTTSSPAISINAFDGSDDGKDNIALAAQVEGITQGLANASFLALPIFIISSNNAAELFPLRAGWTVYLGCCR